MRWWFRRARVVERTCLACGETRTLPAEIAHAKPRKIQRGFSARDVRYAQDNPMTSGSGPGMDQQIAEAQRRDAEADREVELFRELRSCPKCGSERYEDRTV